MKGAANTISLIGMPGCGKSTVGVLLAKLAGLRFVDTDLEIQQRERATLQDILEARGYRHLRDIEHEVLMTLPLADAVVATGGSCVYSADGMARLATAGPVVYLEAEMALLRDRVQAAPPRGIASDPQLSYAQLFAERTPLYRRHANLIVNTDNSTPAQLAANIAQKLQD